jgi:hypothetical protein
MNDNRFTIADHDYFMKTSPKDLADAKKVHNRGFREALEDGALLRKGLIKYMREQGVWDDKKEEQYQIFIKKIGDLEFKLSSGKMKVSEGRAMAIELSQIRTEFRELISERNLMDANTAEGQADNARFNFLLTKSVYDYNTQKPVYESLDDYVNRGSEPLAMDLASKFANFFYGVDENYDKELVENKFLRRFKLIDEDGRFLNKDGSFVDKDGQILDKEGYRLNEDGIRVDINGHPLDVNIETAEFEED